MIICYLPPIKGTRKLHWNSKCSIIKSSVGEKCWSTKTSKGHQVAAAWLWKFQTRVWSKFYFKFQRLSGQFMKWTSIDLYFELGFEAKQFKSYWLVGQWDGRSWGHWCKCCWNDLFLYRAALDLWESDLSLFRTALKTSGSSLIMDP